MRKAMYAGSFYEPGVNFLKRQIEECFLHEKGPGALPGKETGEKVLGAIVPHAGYSFSGPAAAWAYKAIAEAKKPDFFIIIGTNHHSPENITTNETFELPFGFVRVEQEFVKKLLEKGNIKIDDKTHQAEHSIEVQLPFLQYIYGPHPEKTRIVPILAGSEKGLKELGVDIKETLVETGKNAVIICSTDFTHYGRNYHYVPFTIDVPEKIYELDKQAMGFISNMDPEGFLNFCDKKMTSICGDKAIALLLYSLPHTKVMLEQYYTSGDLSGDYKNSVSYAAMLFK